MSETELSFGRAYRQKFMQLLEHTAASLSSGERAEICRSVCSPSPVYARPKSSVPYMKIITGTVLVAALVLVLWCMCKDGGKPNIFGDLKIDMGQIDSSLSGKSENRDVQIVEPGSAIPKTGKHLVMLHHASCGHCVKTKPYFQNIATRMKQAKFHLCDADSYEKLPSEQKDQFKLQGYPTFCYFKDGTFQGEHVGGTKSESDLEQIFEKLLQ